MESQLNSVFSSKNNKSPQSLITLNGMKLHSCALLYINSITMCELYLNGERVYPISKGALLFVDRDTTLNFTLKRPTRRSSYYLYILSDDELQSAYEWLHAYSYPKNIQYKTISNDLFMFILNDWERSLFLELHKKKLPIQKKHAILNYLVSNIPNNDVLFSLLSLSLKNSFSCRTRKIILNDISNNWRISDISNIINMSESTIKKKLYSENYTFKSLLLETRMNHAAKMILSTDKHINMIASSVGYSSPSYFIKAFKEHFNITPKQLSMQFKKGHDISSHFNENGQYIKTLPTR